jgi:GNAT superfamily N-acetyltransferase
MPGDRSPSVRPDSGAVPTGAFPSGYPVEFEGQAVATDGRPFRIRPITPADGPSLVDFHSRLSSWSIYLRFFGAHPRLSESDVERFTHVDYRDRLALIALDGDRIVGVARYDRSGGGPEAEVAFVVADDHQHRGIGTILLERLAAAGWANGVTTFVAETLAENHQMLEVFRRSGFPVETRSEHDVVHVRFPIEPDAAYRAAVVDRHGVEGGDVADGGGSEATC